MLRIFLKELWGSIIFCKNDGSINLQQRRQGYYLVLLFIVLLEVFGMKLLNEVL